MNSIAQNILQIVSTDGVSLLFTLAALVAFIIAWMLNRLSIQRIKGGSARIKDLSKIINISLDLSGNYVLQLDVRARYAHNLHGNMLPEEGMSYEDSFSLIHPDDRETYRLFLKSLIEGKTKTAECLMRWKAPDETGEDQWHYMKNLGVAEFANPKLKTPTTLYCTLKDQTTQIKEEEEEQELTDKYRRIFEQSLVGLAFYDKDGVLVAANQKMREILKFQSEDDPFYFTNTIYEMPLFHDILSHRHIEELYFCSTSVILERGVNCYTELRVHPIRDNEGTLLNISLSIRDVTQERELYLNNKRNDAEIRRKKEELQQYETELQYLMDNCDMRFWRVSFKDNNVSFYRGLSTVDCQISLDNITDYFVDQGEAVAGYLSNPEELFKESKSFLCHTRPFFHDGDELQWNYVDIVPERDKDGNLIAIFGVIRNVTDLMMKQELLKEETERANDSGRTKSVFMANMTHEIRTPLNSIVGFSDLLPMLQTAEEKQEIIRVIMENCDMLLRLVNDILAVSSLDSGGIDFYPQETDFSKKFDEGCHSLRQRVTNPNMSFIVDNPFQTFVTEIDSDRVMQVLNNFVTNAVKYTQQGHIKVGYELEERQERNGLYLYCEDTGAGIAKEYQTKIFDRFVKLNDFVQGTGLGLSICKAIADGCHGEIGVISEGEGQGSTFWIWIPCEIKKMSRKTTE